MYDNNPTLLPSTKDLREERQGEVYYEEKALNGSNEKYFYIESYGCQMNFSDSEIVASILAEAGFASTRDMERADLILINTCSIRERLKTRSEKDSEFLIRLKNPDRGLW